MKIKRRNFLKKSGLIAGGAYLLPTIIPSSAFGANDKITIGMIGTGIHGTNTNLKAYLKLADDCQVIAACDVDSSHVQRAKGLIDEQYQNKDCTAYKDFRELLERRDIDAVQISTPDHWHAPIAMMAIKKKKDVCCEKPTFTIEQGRIVSDFVAKSDQVFLTSTEDRSVFQYHRMAELVRNGRIGKLKRMRVGLPGAYNLTTLVPDFTKQPVPQGFDYDMWLGPAPLAPYCPARCHFNFRWINDYSGGSLTDWGAHMIDNAQWINGTEKTGPVEVVGKGSAPETGIYNAFDKFKLTYTYGNGVVLDVHGDFIEIYCEGTDGWLLVKGWRGKLESSSEKILNSVIGDNEIHLYTDESEHKNFLKCIRSRKATFNPVEDGHRTSSMAHMGNIAMKLQRKLRWNPATEEFINDAEANLMRNREEREKWQLKKLLG